MPSIFNDQNLHFLSEYYIVVSPQLGIVHQSSALSRLLGNIKDEKIDSIFNLTNDDQTLIPDAKSLFVSDKGFHLYHPKTQLGFAGIVVNVTDSRKAFILNPDKVTHEKMNTLSGSEKLHWELLYHLASNQSFQINQEGLLESVGRLCIRETNFASFHWHWLRDNQFVPSRNWIFRKTDPASELTKKLNQSDSELSQLLISRFEGQSKGALFALDEAFLPYKHVMLIPISCEGTLLGVLQFYSQNSIATNDNSQTTLAELLQNEVNRQVEMGANQERERDQVVQLAQASRLSALGAMAGGIAHEINNPLTIIMGMLKMTIKELTSDRPVDREKLSGILEKARQHTERISKIVKGIRALSRDGSRDPFILSKVQDIIDSTFALCEASIKTNSIQLSYDLEDPDQMIQCRPVQISQVILNLINNSMDAIGDQTNPWIHVAVRKMNEESVEFSVTDSGSGIPESIAIRLMQPFFTTKGAGKGTGLGLSISQEIVKAHSGRFSLDRDFPNTRFVIQLPIDQNSIKANAS